MQGRKRKGIERRNKARQSLEAAGANVQWTQWTHAAGWRRVAGRGKCAVWNAWMPGRKNARKKDAEKEGFACWFRPQVSW
jgi:hypothetical protein